MIDAVVFVFRTRHREDGRMTKAEETRKHEDAMVLAVKRGAAKKEDPKKEVQIDHESNSEVSRK